MFNEQEHKDTSLLDTRLDFIEQYDCDILRAAIHKRFIQKAVNFMQTILARHMIQRFEYELIEKMTWIILIGNNSTHFQY